MDRMGVDLNDQNLELGGGNTAPSDMRVQEAGVANNARDHDPSGHVFASTQGAPEVEVAGLDMDMIIQSFIRQQSRPVEMQHLCEQADRNPSVSATLPFGTLGAPAPVMLPLPDEALSFDYIDDDMLFGFNGSPRNTMLY